MRSKKVLATIIASSIILSACSVGGKEKWTNFSDKKIDENIADNSGIVFYRNNSSQNNYVINVTINGEYQASLQPNGYSEAIVCAQPQRLGAFFAGSDIGYAQKHNNGQYFMFDKGKVSYFRVGVDTTNNPVLTEVDKTTAEREMKLNKYQSHTLSRVEHSKTCGEYKYVLPSSILFPSNKSSIKYIHPNGYKEIQVIGSHIQRYSNKINFIEIIGYTDPVGSTMQNNKLSQQRAQAVQSILVQSGVNNVIKISANDESNLEVKGCSEKYSKDKVALNICNQSNRRVEIKINFKK